VLNQAGVAIPVAVVHATPLKIITAWLRQEEDIGHQFDVEFRCIDTLRNERVLNAQTVVMFPQGDHNSLARFLLSLQGIPDFLHHPGIVFFEHRVRRQGTDAWLSQKYALIVGDPVTDPAPTPSTSDASQ